MERKETKIYIAVACNPNAAPLTYKNLTVELNLILVVSDF